VFGNDCAATTARLGDQLQHRRDPRLDPAIDPPSTLLGSLYFLDNTTRAAAPGPSASAVWAADRQLPIPNIATTATSTRRSSLDGRFQTRSAPASRKPPTRRSCTRDIVHIVANLRLWSRSCNQDD
jgi:hypothetical protein